MVRSRPRFTVERTAINSCFLDVYAAGPESAQSVVLVHGIGASNRYFMPLAEELALKYRVYILCLPGYGTTPKPVRALSVEELAVVVGDCLAAARLRPAVIIGHSMGCQIVAHVLRRYRSLCSRAILIAPTVNRKERTRLAQFMRLVQDMFFEPPLAVWLVAGDYWRMGLRRYLETARSMVEDRIEVTLTGLKLPIFFVRGNRDKVVPEWWVRELAQSVAHGQIEQVAGAPHVIQIQQSGAMAELCQQFIDRR